MDLDKAIEQFKEIEEFQGVDQSKAIEQFKAIQPFLRTLAPVSERNSANPRRTTIGNALLYTSSAGSDLHAKRLLEKLASVRNHKKGNGAYARAGKGMSLAEIQEQAAILLMASQALRYLPGPNLMELLLELINARGRRAHFQRESSPREKAMEILASEPDIGNRELARRVDVSPSTVTRWGLLGSSSLKRSK